MANAYADALLVAQRAGVTFADLGLADQGTLDALIVKLNERASAAIEDYTKRDFLAHSNVTESYDGTDDAVLDLRGWPVTSVTSVTDSGTILVAGTDYRLRPALSSGEAAGVLDKADGTWARDWGRYSVVYSYGYASPPLDVKRVTEDVIVRALQAAKAAREAAGASSVSMDGFSTTYDHAAVAGELLTEDKAALAKWRFLRVA